MASLWAETLDRGGILAVEAPTGIGKSLAYLIPALWLRARGSGPIVVSTYTKTLQDQLLARDVPLALRATGLPMRVATLKGRSSYLCRRRAHARLAQRRLFDAAGLDEEAFHRLEDWVERTRNGALEELAALGIHLPPPLLADIASDPFTCAGTACEPATGCFAKTARRDARRSDLVVVNHALLLSDPGLRSTLLAESGALVLDEAHHLERVAREQQGISIGAQDLARLAARTDARSGALRLLARALRRGKSETAAAAVASADRALRPVLAHAAEIAVDLASILPPGVPAALWPRGVDLASVSPHAVDQCLAAIGSLTRSLSDAVGAAEADSGASLRPGAASLDAIDEVRGRLGRWVEVEQALRAVVRIEERGVAFYVDRDERGGPRLNRRPLEVGESLRATLFSLSERTLLTSATLAPGDRLEPIVETLGLPEDEVETLRLPSPFPLERQMTTLALDGPEPNDPSFVETLAALVVAVAGEVRRNTLVLLTSYQMLEDLASRVRAPLAARGVALLAQAPGEAAAPLAREFREGAGSVLLGTASFWEGVDFPGEALEVLVIARLPFAVPTDPVVAARSERIAESGGDPFRDLMLPEAVLRFRQGVGRLIRTVTDRGAVVVADPRLLRAAYGARFAAVLPAPPRVARSTGEVAAAVREWFA
ncbi:MAG TPA: ATP-dependent DNA helicase [Candidatus Eisenbacteria bacterium]